MTGVSELVHLEVVSAAPERIRVSVFGGRTQLDIALPLDVPIAGFLPDLARLISSRDIDRETDPHIKNERRTFWVLSNFADGTELHPEQTLREAGVDNGQLLRLTSQRALPPPTLYDDVVDAAARLNKAAYAAWDAVSARWMAFIGLHLGAWVLTVSLFLPVDSVQRAVMAALAGVAVVALVAVGAIAHRSHGLDQVAAAAGWAAIPITVGIAWAVAGRHGGYWLVGGFATVPVLTAGYHRLIGTGQWAYLATAVPAVVGGAAVAAVTAGLPVDAVSAATAVLTLLGCLTVPRLTARLGQFPQPLANPDAEPDEWAFENPFQAPAKTKADRQDDSGVAMPTAEAVLARVQAAAVTRSALLTALAGSAVAAVATLLHVRDTVGWPELALAGLAAALLGLRSRLPATWVERFGLAVPALVLLIVAAVSARHGREPMPLVGIGVLLTVAVGAALIGLVGGKRPVSRWATPLAYLEYLTTAAVPLAALWVVGFYQRLGPWR